MLCLIVNFKNTVMKNRARLHFSTLLTTLQSTDYIPADLIVSLFYIHRFELSPAELRSYLSQFVNVGFNPFACDLTPSSKVMMKSVISRCDSCVK